MLAAPSLSLQTGTEQKCQKILHHKSIKCRCQSRTMRCMASSDVHKCTDVNVRRCQKVWHHKSTKCRCQSQCQKMSKSEGVKVGQCQKMSKSEDVHQCTDVNVRRCQSQKMPMSMSKMSKSEDAKVRRCQNQKMSINVPMSILSDFVSTFTSQLGRFCFDVAARLH